MGVFILQQIEMGFWNTSLFSSACWDCAGKVTQCLYQRRQNPLPVMYVFILKLNILMYYLFLKCHGIDSELSPPGRPLKLKE